MRARVYDLSVLIGTCQLAKLRAGTPCSMSAIANKALLACSPVVASISNSRRSGFLAISLAKPNKRFVSPAIADGTTTTLYPAACHLATRCATFLIRSTEPIDVPPNFITITDMLNTHSYLIKAKFIAFQHSVVTRLGLAHNVKRPRRV